VPGKVRATDRAAGRCIADVAAELDAALRAEGTPERAEQEKRYLVTVRDNGPGIAPEHQASLFSKLSRGWNNPAQRPEGSGLGLAISHQIMRHMGGDLVLVNSDAGGSCFAMRFSAS